MIDKLIDWWRRRRWTRARYPRMVAVDRRTEVPALPGRRTVALIGPRDRPQWVVFACPCGHAHLIALNLLPTRCPFWTAEEAKEGLTIRPSVDARWQGRRCHFWLRNGAVHWTTDEPQEVIHAESATAASS
jgi:hypothetical protein